MKKLLSLTRAAVDKYNMISEGDKIAVGVSGGKDSLALLLALAKIRDFYPQRFDIVAITLDYRFYGEDGDYSRIKAFCDELNVEYVVKPTNLWQVIFDERKEKNPCSLCAKMRRGVLHDTAKEYGCNKIALGHHLDDAAETFIMNLFNGGQISCFSPVSYLSRKGLYLIRPMIFAEERYINRVSKKLELPIVKSKCPADGCTERQKMKEMIGEWKKSIPDIKEKTIGAMQRAGISKW